MPSSQKEIVDESDFARISLLFIETVIKISGTSRKNYIKNKELKDNWM